MIKMSIKAAKSKEFDERKHVKLILNFNIFWRYFTPAPALGRIVRMILSFKCYFLFRVFYTHTNIAFEIFVQKNFPTKNEKIIFMYTESLMGLDILGKIGFNLALGLVTSCCGYLETYMLLAVARVHEPW